MEDPDLDDFWVSEWKHWMRNMTILDFLTIIKAELSPGAKVLSDSRTEEFASAHQRWSDLNVQIPGAIVLVVTEDDIVNTVRCSLHFLARNSLPNPDKMCVEVQYPIRVQSRRPQQLVHHRLRWHCD
jgi:hypothetical protein